ncbi:hypothetical protein BDE02_13G087200 [Populus trichocarpa]|nr:hypothetical protein BDE02_13G087200 [Populus trichocarpa]
MNEAKKMVVALVDMERAFVPPQHFIRLVQRRMETQRREEELKNRSSKNANDAEHAILNRATSPQTSGSLKSLKEKSNPAEKEVQEGSGLKTAGPEGEITAGFLSKKSAKSNGWSKRWFVLNEKTGKLGYTKKQEERHFHCVITWRNAILKRFQMRKDLLQRVQRIKKPMDQMLKHPVLFLR